MPLFNTDVVSLSPPSNYSSSSHLIKHGTFYPSSVYFATNKRTIIYVNLLQSVKLIQSVHNLDWLMDMMIVQLHSARFEW